MSTARESRWDITPADDALADQYDGDIRAAWPALQDDGITLVYRLLASDTGALSAEEVAWRHPDLEVAAVREKLGDLVEAAFVVALELDTNSVADDIPRVYYAPSPLAIHVLQVAGIYDGLGIMWQIYDAMERPEYITRIEEWEGRPEPDWLPDPNG